MQRIKSQLARDPASYINRMTWAACCTGFFGFLRCSGFLLPDQGPFDPSCHLSIADISLRQSTSPWYFVVNIKKSKTDQFGATGPTTICPVSALLDFLAVRGDAPGPLFIFPDGSPLRRGVFVHHVQSSLAASGLTSSNFNGHSFRIGAATTASAALRSRTEEEYTMIWQSY